MRPTVSVVMSSYNYGRYLPTAIESVLHQTFDDFELVIVDDASVDDSRDIIISYSQRDSRVRYVFHRTNRGIARTFNDGIKKSRGKFVAFISSDDVWLPEKLELQMKILDDDPNLVVWGEGIVIDENGNPMGFTTSQLLNAIMRKKRGDIRDDLFLGNYIFGSTAIVRRKNLKKSLILYDETLPYSNDYKFFLELAAKYCFEYIPEPIAYYRVHGMNTTFRGNRTLWLTGGIKVRDYILRKYWQKLSPLVSSKIELEIASFYLELEDRQKALEYWRRAIRNNPLAIKHAEVFVRYVTNNNPSVVRFLLSVYRKLFNIPLVFYP